MNTRIRGGFNKTWNLPLPQVLSIKAGSVFVYNKNSELLDRLEMLKITGIGEKREEGYGRIAVNWHRVSEIKILESIPNSPSFSEIKDPRSLYLAKRIVERMTREKLDQALIEKVNRLGIIKETIPKKSQLSRMRIIVRRSLYDRDFNKVTKYLDEMKKAAKGQFQNAQIDGDSLEQWIRKIITFAEKPQEFLDILLPNRPSLGEIKPELGDELAHEYAVRLIDAVLHKSSKEVNNE